MKVNANSSFQNNRQDNQDLLSQEHRKRWVISSHCISLVFPTPYPDVCFDTRSCKYYYKEHVSNVVPDQELRNLTTQAHYRVLAKLNQSKLQVRNFILPVELMKMKYIDPYSRQRVIEELCKYMSLQKQVRNVVLEQAAITFSDLCRLLLAIAHNSVRRLYLWNVLEKCQAPFKGLLQNDINLDNVPRIPYTYNPGGRKYLKELEKIKHEDRLQHTKVSSQNNDKTNKPLGYKTMKDSDVFSQVSWIESLLHNNPEGSNSLYTTDSYKKLLKLFCDSAESQKSVYSRVDVCIQCNISEDQKDSISKKPKIRSIDVNDSSETLATVVTRTKIDFMKNYLKLYENCEIEIKILREIYIVALNGLTYLTTLSINYALLADGTGDILLSIGSVIRGRLKNLELLCQIEDLPSPIHQRYDQSAMHAIHQQYDQSAMHAIPDIIWKHVKCSCPYLKVHIVCVSMACYDVIKMFITKSIPLYSFHVDSVFCPTLVKPQIALFSTLKFLYHYFKATLENITIVLWYSSGRIDSSLETFIKEATHLHSFEYCGPLQYKASINKLCEAALLPSSKIVNFKLLIQGDPCFPHISQELTAELYKKYRPMFLERSIQFVLRTHNS